jgi:hypothetical protein
MVGSSARFAHVLESVREFSPQEQLDLLEEIAALLRTTLSAQSKHSILELEGLGAEIWRGVGAQEYVNEERA